jgi:hypothetical protein
MDTVTMGVAFDFAPSKPTPDPTPLRGKLSQEENSWASCHDALIP